MRHLVTLVATSLPSEETVLAHVKVEALLAVVAEPYDGAHLANSALDPVVLG